MNYNIKILPKKICILLGFFVLYCCFIFSFPSIDFITSIMCIFMGCFYMAIVLFVRDFFSPWGFLFIYQFLGYIDLTMVSIGISYGKARYEPIIYTISFSIMLLWSLAFTIGYIKILKLKKHEENDNTITDKENNVNIYVILIPCIFAYLYALYTAISTANSLGGLYQGMLGGGKVFSDQGYLMQILAMAGIIPVLYLYKNLRIKAFIYMILICVGILLTGRRSLAITTTLIPFLIYWNNKISRINLKKILVITLPVIFVVLFIGSIRTAEESQFSNMNTTNLILNNIAVLGKYNGYGTNIPAMVNEIHSGNIDFQGFKYFARGLEYLIPRSIWIDKPLVHSSDIVSNVVFFVGDVGRPVGPYGWAYFNFGICGVILSGIFTGQIAKQFYIWAVKHGSLISLSFYGILILPVIEIFQPEAQMRIIIFSVLYYIIYITSSRLKIKF